MNRKFAMKLFSIVVMIVAFDMSAALAAGHRIPAAMGEVVAKEPPTGGLQFGQTVLVNDGSCPAGQMKQVTGGNTARGVPRRRECVAH